jgi:hypothetical protein
VTLAALLAGARWLLRVERVRLAAPGRTLRPTPVAA